MTDGMCTCAVHCPLSGYHEKACCDKTTCECWCHRTFREEVTFKCPFCGVDCAAVDPPGVVHAMPPCQGFIDLDPLEFIRVARRAMERRN